MTDNTVADRFYGALSDGDVEVMRACFADGGVIWHSFDGEAQDVATAAVGWAGLIGVSSARELHDVRRHVTSDGLVQQHVFVMTTPSGDRRAWPVCLVVHIKDDLIVRLEEYMDRAGSFTPTSDPAVTPGF